LSVGRPNRLNARNIIRVKVHLSVMGKLRTYLIEIFLANYRKGLCLLNDQVDPLFVVSAHTRDLWLHFGFLPNRGNFQVCFCLTA
jgi:hypothetical protein